MRSRLLGVVAVLVVAGLISGALTTTSVSDPGAPAADALVSPQDAEGYVWPYTSQRRTVADRTLALNVIVRGEPDRVRRVLEDRSAANWSAVDEERVPEASPWGPARGSPRYTYLASASSESGRWARASYQLGVGTYLGRRTHVRAYPAQVGDWTALQAHAEYWDWFRLRHTVTSVEAGSRFVERDLRDEPFVGNVSREYHGHTGGGSDGWITVIGLVPAADARPALPTAVGGAALPAVAVGVTLPVVGRRLSTTEALLPAALAGVVLGVRTAGVVAEGLFSGMDPKLFAAVLYPVLVAGPPLAVWYLVRDSRPTRAALLAAAGLGAGFVFDFAAVSVNMVPIRLVLHRVALVAALALTAQGVALADRRRVTVGLVVWVLALAGTLLGVV